MNQKKELQVAALENGTVIDHIPSDRLFDVVNLLALQDVEYPITIGNNLESKKHGHKGIIKIADRFLSEEEISRLAIISSSIKLNIIKNYEVVEKRTATLPDVLIGIVTCPNPKCISNNEPMPTYFHVVDAENGILKCHYCEKEQSIQKQSKTKKNILPLP